MKSFIFTRDFRNEHLFECFCEILSPADTSNIKQPLADQKFPESLKAEEILKEFTLFAYPYWEVLWWVLIPILVCKNIIIFLAQALQNSLVPKPYGRAQRVNAFKSPSTYTLPSIPEIVGFLFL